MEKRTFCTQEEIFKPTSKKLSDFKEGEIYEFLPTPHSRFRVSFFAEVKSIDINSKRIIMSMDNKSVSYDGTGTYTLWENNLVSNMNRMVLVGTKDKDAQLLKNEILLDPIKSGDSFHKIKI